MGSATLGNFLTNHPIITEELKVFLANGWGATVISRTGNLVLDLTTACRAMAGPGFGVRRPSSVGVPILERLELLDRPVGADAIRFAIAMPSITVPPVELDEADLAYRYALFGIPDPMWCAQGVIRTWLEERFQRVDPAIRDANEDQKIRALDRSAEGQFMTLVMVLVDSDGSTTRWFQDLTRAAAKRLSSVSPEETSAYEFRGFLFKRAQEVIEAARLKWEDQDSFRQSVFFNLAVREFLLDMRELGSKDREAYFNLAADCPWLFDILLGAVLEDLKPRLEADAQLWNKFVQQDCPTYATFLERLASFEDRGLKPLSPEDQDLVDRLRGLYPHIPVMRGYDLDPKHSLPFPYDEIIACSKEWDDYGWHIQGLRMFLLSGRNRTDGAKRHQTVLHETIHSVVHYKSIYFLLRSMEIHSETLRRFLCEGITDLLAYHSQELLTGEVSTQGRITAQALVVDAARKDYDDLLGVVKSWETSYENPVACAILLARAFGFERFVAVFTDPDHPLTEAERQRLQDPLRAMAALIDQAAAKNQHDFNRLQPNDARRLFEIAKDLLPKMA